MEGFSA